MRTVSDVLSEPILALVFLQDPFCGAVSVFLWVTDFVFILSNSAFPLRSLAARAVLTSSRFSSLLFNKHVDRVVFSGFLLPGHVHVISSVSSCVRILTCHLLRSE